MRKEKEMGIFDKLSNLIFEEEPSNQSQSKKTKSSQDKKGKWTDIFFEEAPTEETHREKKKKFSDIFFEQVPEEDDGIKSTFVTEEDKTSILNDISSQIERRESELINLAEFFKSVNPKDYPDSAPEYEAYLSLVQQLNAIKELSASSSNQTINSMGNYSLEGSFRKFETDYKAHINSIRSLCYLSELANLNSQLETIFDSHFTSKTDEKIEQIDEYILLISKKSASFDKKYSTRLYKELIEAEYRMTMVRLMCELKNGRNPRKNPFASYPLQKKKTFETYLSKYLRESNAKYNKIADSEEKYTRYGLVRPDFFDRLDADVDVISEQINRYTLDDFLLMELLENGEGFESLKRFLAFKVNLNFIDSQTQEADTRFLDDSYKKATSAKPVTPKRTTSSSKIQNSQTKRRKQYPSFDEDL